MEQPGGRHDPSGQRIRSLLHAAGIATTTEDPTADGTATHQALPLVTLLNLTSNGSMYCCVTTVDDRGRLADRTPLRVLGWEPSTPTTIAMIPSVGIIVVRLDGPDAITRQGHLRLPANIRHGCRLAGGERLLVMVHPDQDVLVAYTPTAVDRMVSAYHANMLTEDVG
jgi:bifunctional DNA-binding transcriptional regulator/antitoxin component of YhaV-PrlF toxin-antitoxin module